MELKRLLSYAKALLASEIDRSPTGRLEVDGEDMPLVGILNDVEQLEKRIEASRVAVGVAVVETDNYGGDYPDEKFLNAFVGNKEQAQVIADALNAAHGHGRGEPAPQRFFKVVERGYKLQPGFEP